MSAPFTQAQEDRLREIMREEMRAAIEAPILAAAEDINAQRRRARYGFTPISRTAQQRST